MLKTTWSREERLAVHKIKFMAKRLGKEVLISNTVSPVHQLDALERGQFLCSVHDLCSEPLSVVQVRDSYRPRCVEIEHAQEDEVWQSPQRAAR